VLRNKGQNDCVLEEEKAQKCIFGQSSTWNTLEAFTALRRPYLIEGPTSKEGEMEPTSKGMGGIREEVGEGNGLFPAVKTR